MANKTINDLTTTTSAAAADLVPIWVAGSSVTRKITKANFIGAVLTGGGTIATGGFTLTVPATGTAALLGTAQTFTAAHTFTPAQTMTGGINVGVAANLLYRPAAGIVRQEVEGASLANDGTLTVSADNSARGFLIVYNQSAGTMAVAVASGSAGVTLLHNGGTGFSNASGNAGTINIYTSSTNIVVQNKIGSAQTLAIAVID